MATVPNPNAQQIRGSDTSIDIGEALEARVRDPMWFLVRQWQSGEFEAENGGHIASMSVEWRLFRCKTIAHSGGQSKVDPAMPLQRCATAKEACS